MTAQDDTPGDAVQQPNITATGYKKPPRGKPFQKGDPKKIEPIGEYQFAALQEITRDDAE